MSNHMLIILVIICSLLHGVASFILPTSFNSLKNKQNKVPALNQFKNFDDMMEKLDVPVLVDFYAQWCGPCVMMQPILEDVARRLENEARVAKVDTEKSPKLGSRYQVEALPTLILFNKGEIVEKFIGYRTADELESGK